LDMTTQRRNLAGAAHAIAQVARVDQVVVTHGNGPQIGFLALQEAAAGDAAPLDVLGAETEGMIGYLIEQAVRNAMPGREAASLLTQTVVDPADPAFGRPTKPIGPVYDQNAADRLARERGWRFAADGGLQRRVVPSPEPRAIVELETIRLLVRHGVLVIAAGGGGIPVVVDAAGGLRGVAAVIDKDLASALLAERLGAGALLLLTDVPAVERDWRTPDATPIHETTPRELRSLQFEAGTMGPKVEAACRFVEAGGRLAGIGRLDDAADILRGQAGTIVRTGDAGTPDAEPGRRAR
ncbi:MAG TPA: carbamate kinase, partial [Thermomicrobiales bacterium]|nr:carbamate kinase [Thermomicrobiales bacterium]